MTSNDYIEKNIIEKLKFKNQHDKTVCNRIYSKPLSNYKEKLKSLNLTNKKKVLDVGCGFGQWTLALSEFNEEIYSIDMEFSDLIITKSLSDNLSKKNISIVSGSIEKLPFPNESFDAAFSYSVLYYTDFKKSVKEIYRILKPGGVFYSSVIGIGWCLNRFLSNTNYTSESNVRKFAIDTLLSTLNYFFTGEQKKGYSIALTPNMYKKFLQNIGFKNVLCAPEGHILLNPKSKIQPFYKSKFLGFPIVFETYVEK